jgi:hypothetical protein
MSLILTPWQMIQLQTLDFLIVPVGNREPDLHSDWKQQQGRSVGWEWHQYSYRLTIAGREILEGKPGQPCAMDELVLACRPTFIELPTEGTAVSVGGNRPMRQLTLSWAAIRGSIPINVPASGRLHGLEPSGMPQDPSRNADFRGSTSVTILAMRNIKLLHLFTSKLLS